MNIDFHAHILPGADHGSTSLKTSLEQLALAKAAGIDLIVATPHFYPQQESVETFLARREQCAARLRDAAKDAPQLLIGGEIQLCRGLHHIDAPERLCIEGTNVLLLELPPAFSMRTMASTLDALLYECRLNVVLAHIDRYDPAVINSLLDAGFLAQLNASAFCRLRGRRRCLHWAADESVVALGSDLHGISVGYREFTEAKRRLGADYAAVMRRTQKLLNR